MVAANAEFLSFQMYIILQINIYGLLYDNTNTDYVYFV